MSDSDVSHLAITNIPNDFHAADLRAHFTAFVESGAFVCFHFRHRPEKNISEKQSQSVERNGQVHVKLLKRCCVVKVKTSRLNDFQRSYNNEQWTDDSNTYYADRCHISLLKLSSNSDEIENSDEYVEEKKLLAMPEMKPPELMPNGNVGTPTLVFLNLIQRCLLPDRLIKTLKLKFPKTEAKRIYSNVSFLYDDREKDSTAKRKYPKLFDSNCGRTSSSLSTKSSDDLILDKNCDNSNVDIDSSVRDINQKDEEIFPRNSLSKDSVNDKNLMTKRESKKLKKLERKETLALMNENIEEHLIGIEKKYHNDDDAEEWDRHEASEDDPSNQERNKERLYEEEIEQPWEKGGPGVVFYTDAMYWQAKDGDFDEQTTDDLDVDFSPYEGDSAGDKDIQDFLKIRQERRFRSGHDKTDRFSIGIGKKIESDGEASSSKFSSLPSPLFKQPPLKHKIGKFDIHTKGIGRKILEKQGWTDGQGLGKSESGIKEALRGEGQRPQVKKGLGFVEAKPVVYSTRAKRSITHHITTAMDNPYETDAKEMFMQRQEPTALKYRKSFLDNFAPTD